MVRDRAFWIALALLSGGYAILPWTLDVVPGHDLPQHLAYARILRDLGDPSLELGSTYYAVQPFDRYFAVHHALAALGGVIGIVPACKVVYSIFAVVLPLSAVAMCRAVWRESAPWSALLSTCLVWNPVACMGFLPFMLALPAALLAIGAYVRATRHPTTERLALVALAMGAVAFLHVVAAAMTLLFLAVRALVGRRGRALFALAAAAGGSVGCSAVLPGQASRVHWGELATDIVQFGPISGVSGYFRMSWTSVGEKLRLLFGTIPGAFTLNVRLALLAVVAGVALIVAFAPHGPRNEGAVTTSARAHPWAVGSFAALSFVVPTAMQVPDDVCLLDLRMLAVAALAGCAAIPPRLLVSVRARAATASLAATILVTWAVTLSALSREAAPVLGLVRTLGPKDRVLALAMHGSSDHLDPSNALTHYLPIYALVERAAPVTSFWGDFAPHLPVGYRAPPACPPDWAPWKVEPSHIAAATHVLLERSYAAPELSGATARLMSDPTLEPVACEARWCLFRVRESARVTSHGTTNLR